MIDIDKAVELARTFIDCPGDECKRAACVLARAVLAMAAELEEHGNGIAAWQARGDAIRAIDNKEDAPR